MAFRLPETPEGKAARLSYERYKQNPDPSFNDKVYSRARESGFSSANRWLVLIFPNEYVRQQTAYNMIGDTTRLAITCKSVNTNDQSWYTNEQTQLTAGPNRVLPYRKNSTNTSGVKLQWNLGADMYEKEFFEEWMRLIQNPYSRQIQYYDTYAKDSYIYIMLLPNHVQNFFQAIEAVDQGKIVGYHLTEVYPYSLNINGGVLNYQAATEPMFVDVGFMYRDVVPLYGGFRNRMPNIIPMITDTGYPVIEEDKYSDVLASSQLGLDRAVEGFALGTIAERAAFNTLRQNQHSILRQYTQQLEQYKNTDFPRAVDGRVVYSTPKQGALDLGLSILQDTQGFLGAGFFGNGFYP